MPLVGKGGYARVYERRSSSGRLFAEKVLERELVSDLQYEREVEALSRIRSAHIPELIGHKQTASKSSIYMTLIKGEEASGPRDPWVLKQLARAVYDVHRSGWAHRDIKWENVMVTSNKVWLIDYGFAVPLHHKRLSSERCGTELLMSPEVLDRTVTDWAASDVWSLGITFYEISTGLAYEHGDSIRTGSNGLDRLIKGMMRTRPSDRMTMPEVLDRMNRVD